MNPYVIFKYMYWRNNSIFTLCTQKNPPIGQRVVNYAVPKAKFCMETYSIDMHLSLVKVSTYYITQKIMASQPWTWSWKWNDHVIAFMGPWNCWKAREGGTARRKMVMVWSGVLHWIIRFGLIILSKFITCETLGTHAGSAGYPSIILVCFLRYTISHLMPLTNSLFLQVFRVP